MTHNSNRILHRRGDPDGREGLRAAEAGTAGGYGVGEVAGGGGAIVALARCVWVAQRKARRRGD